MLSPIEPRQRTRRAQCAAKEVLEVFEMMLRPATLYRSRFVGADSLDRRIVSSEGIGISRTGASRAHEALREYCLVL